MLGVPIGTIIAIRVLNCIKDNDLKRYFGSKALEL
jgi:hypothetical protein